MNSNEWSDFWRYDIGVNVIPAVTKTKKPKVKWTDDPQGNWQKSPIPKELHEEWKSSNMFENGMAIICGEIFHNESKKGLWINGIDCDNKMAIDEFCTKFDGTQGTIHDIAKDTLVEQHSNKEKCHILFYSKSPIKDKAQLKGEDIPKLEIKSGGKFILYCSGGIHKDGSPIEILDKKIPSIVDKDRLESKLESIFRKYDLEYITKLTLSDYQKPIYDISGKLYQGNNRGVHILSYLDSKKIKNPELNFDDLFHLARKYEKENCCDVYDDEKINHLVEQAMIYGESKILQHDNGTSSDTNNPKRKTIDQTAHLIESGQKFLTLRKSDDILLYNGKIYDDSEAQSIIKEEVEKIIDSCTTHQRNEVVNKIKAQTYTDDDSFDSDVNTITIDNGVLNINTLELKVHSENNLMVWSLLQEEHLLTQSF